MKHISKKSALGLFLLIVAVLIGCVNAILITVDTDYNKLHKIRLHTLNVGTGDYYAKFMVGKDQDVLWFSSGLVIGDTIKYEETWDPNNEGLFMGGGKDNGLGSQGIVGVGGGFDNNNGVAASNTMGVIGGGETNSLAGNGGVVLGGYYNYAATSGAVVGGSSNRSFWNAVILGGKDNEARNSSLAFGLDSKAKENNSFSWNANNNKERSARIDASNGVLIGTYTGINNVNLVVNGAMKIDSRGFTGDGFDGEIAVVDGCFYAYDGHNWHVINKGGGCATASIPEGSCIFGNVILLHGEAMSGYSVPFDKDCSSKAGDAVCNNTVLEGATYPYCYKLS